MLLALLLMGTAPVDVYVKAEAVAAKARPVDAFGTLRRTPQGTAVVLDDGAPLFLTTDEPPSAWAPLVGRFVRVTGVLDGDRLTGSSAPAPATRNLSKLNGKQVELTGVAENAKGGAILLVDDGPIYLRKLDSWPDNLRGKSVVVKGTLKSMKLIPSPERGPDGAISQGAEGSQWVLEDPRY